VCHSVDGIILDLNRRPGEKRITFAALYVGVTRAKRGAQLRILPPLQRTARAPFPHLFDLRPDPALHVWLGGFVPVSPGSSIKVWKRQAAIEAARSWRRQVQSRPSAARGVAPGRGRRTAAEEVPQEPAAAVGTGAARTGSRSRGGRGSRSRAGRGGGRAAEQQEPHEAPPVVPPFEPEHPHSANNLNLMYPEAWIQRMVGDGNCMFHTLSAGLGRPGAHAATRGDLADFIQGNGALFFEYLNLERYRDVWHYVQELRQLRVHGDVLQLAAAAELYRRPIVVLTRLGDEIRGPYSTYYQLLPRLPGRELGAPIFLLYKQETATSAGHYDLLDPPL
jgi:hypothetical protein